MAENTKVAVIVCTRNRPHVAPVAVRSVLACSHPNFELHVVDQSDDDATRIALEPFAGDPRVDYVRSAATGLSAARNAGILRASAELLALTDDDCELPPDHLDVLAETFAARTRAGIVYGNVIAADHDRALGFIPAYTRHGRRLATRIRDKHHVEGIGACMGLRRSTWKALGGFDELLGAGAPLKSAEEFDLTIRSLLAGHHVYETDALSVRHHGFRLKRDKAALVAGHLYGIGAALAKQVKCHPPEALAVLAQLGARWCFARPVVDFGEPLPRAQRLRAFASGFRAGLLLPVDRGSGLFRAGGRPTRS